MSDSTPIVTVVIAARPGQKEVKAVEAARKLDYPKEKLEIIVARGKQPSVQRNQAVREAKGELIYFLDDDSIAAPQNLQRAIGHFEKQEVCMLGGPNLCPPDAPKLEKEFATVMANPLAFGPSRARYAPIGELRESGEKELILCNLIARKSDFLDAGGFDEALYPNEENALMDELQQKGGKLMYDPEFVVHRRPRSDKKAFRKMLLNYGRGRAEQFRLHPSSGSLLNFAPAGLVLSLALMTACYIGIGYWFYFTNRSTSEEFQLFFFGLHFAYVLGYVVPIFASARRNLTFPAAKPLPAAPDEVDLNKVITTQAGLIFTCHICYGLGFWKGLFTPLKKNSNERPKVEVELEFAQSL